MDGPKVDSWKEEQLTHLDNKVSTRTLEINENLWDDFMDSFLKAFTNTNRKAEAYQELCNLKHGESLDSFFADFTYLTKDADIKLDDHGTIEILKNNLKGELVKAIIRFPGYNPTAEIPWKFKDWEKEACNQHLKWQTVEQYGKNRRQAIYKVFGIHPNRNTYNRKGHHTASQGGHHMDIDAAKDGRGNTTFRSQKERTDEQ